MSPAPRSSPSEGTLAVAAPTAAAIDVRDLSQRLGTRWVLAHMSFAIARAESVLLAGPNGAGKTTLLRVLSSALPPTLGAVSVVGLDLHRDRDAWRRRVGLMSHASHLYEELTAAENLLVAARILGRPQPRAAAMRCLEKVGLVDRARSPVRTFSAGMRKRLSMARILLKDPEVILLDEPFGELDIAGIEAMEGFVRDFQRRGATVILVTHQVEHGRTICPRELWLRDGRLDPQ